MAQDERIGGRVGHDHRLRQRVDLDRLHRKVVIVGRHDELALAGLGVDLDRRQRHRILARENFGRFLELHRPADDLAAIIIVALQAVRRRLGSSIVEHQHVLLQDAVGLAVGIDAHVRDRCGDVLQRILALDGERPAVVDRELRLLDVADSYGVFLGDVTVMYGAHLLGPGDARDLVRVQASARHAADELQRVVVVDCQHAVVRDIRVVDALQSQNDRVLPGGLDERMAEIVILRRRLQHLHDVVSGIDHNAALPLLRHADDASIAKADCGVRVAHGNRGLSHAAGL